MINDACVVAINRRSTLRNAGVEVDCGLLASQAVELNRDYLKARSTGLPWIIVKVAMSLDGKVGTAGKSDFYITCEESLRTVHQLRASCSGIMVGAETIRTDNPQLTCRFDSFEHIENENENAVIYPLSSTTRNPVRIVISRNPDFSTDTKVLDTSEARTILITSNDIAPDNLLQWKSRGVEVLHEDLVDGEIDLRDVFKKLVNMGVMSILVEGGGVLINSLEKAKLIDEYYLFIAPDVIGGEKTPSWTSNAIKKIISNKSPRDNYATFKSGRDTLIRAR